jgi:hypothetical protein
VASPQNGEQDVVGAQIPRHLDGLDQQDGSGRVGVERQAARAGVADRQGADLDSVVEGRPLELLLDGPRFQSVIPTLIVSIRPRGAASRLPGVH